VFGSLLHQGLAQWHTNGGWHGDNWDAIEQELEILCDPTLPPMTPPHCGHLKTLNLLKEEGSKLNLPSDPSELGFQRYSLEHALRLMFSYMRHWGHPNKDFHALEHNGNLMVEQKLYMPIADRVSFGGTMDLLAENGEPCLVEHKTAGSLYNFSDKARLSLQATGYLALAQHHGIQSQTVIFNGLKSAWRKGDRTLVNGPEKNFQRVHVRKYDWQLAEWRRMLGRDAQRIIEDIEAQEFTQTAPDGCLAFGGTCKFADACASAPDIRDNILKIAFGHNDWPGFNIEVEDE
jgi:hypothetical protein